MLTRLKVSGFKNLLDVDVRFGPFTCIAGPNGVGKSNLIDAIRFLSLLATESLMDAASAVRDPGGRNDPRDLFYNFSQQKSPRMDFEAEMIVPREAKSDFGTNVTPTVTSLRYSLSLGWKPSNGEPGKGGLEMLAENLLPIPPVEFRELTSFPHAAAWSNNVLVSSGTTPHFISADHDQRKILLHDDSGSGLPDLRNVAINLSHTVISTFGAIPILPTVCSARAEFQSWRVLQLEPSSLRRPDEFRDPQFFSPTGAHMPAALYRIASSGDSEAVYTQLANRLSELVGDVGSIEVDSDEARELLTLYLTQRDGTRLPARALSDGTLRFLALAVLSMDPESNSLVCLEEPENGVHPMRIPAMIDLLRDLAADPTDPEEPNPLRQVIFTTHSPLVVKQCPEDSVVFAHTLNVPTGTGRGSALGLAGLAGTWREKAGMESVGIGKVVNYLEPIPLTERGDPKRVIDRDDVRLALGLDAHKQEQ